MNIITPNYGTGITSCLGVRLHEICEFARQTGQYPDGVDGSQQFGWYKEQEGDLTPYFLSGYEKPADDFPVSRFGFMWQYHWYDDIDLISTTALAALTCWPSMSVSKKAAEFSQLMQNRIAVLYRGNDKAKEIPETPYPAMIEMMKDSGSDSFFIQTDDEDFLALTLREFPKSTYISAIPRIRRNLDRYVMPVTGKAQFAHDFLAALFAMRMADGLITTTGNTGLWAVLYRGTLHNTWQYHGQEAKWRKLG